ncbi:hypothetical protein ACJIZ3_007020 [Penstemon smallii]|uniref:Uncharacterized protein n=1 Tax=Penstemon smallii TaxID=265156 RepID=A0ABD3S9D4_9LAMI
MHAAELYKMITCKIKEEKKKEKLYEMNMLSFVFLNFQLGNPASHPPKDFAFGIFNSNSNSNRNIFHLLPYSSPPSIPQLTANSPKEQQTTAKTANQATKFAKSTRPEHVLGGPKQQIAKLNPVD